MAATYELGLQYELARELITGRMAIIAAELGKERTRSPVDADRIAELKAQSLALFVEREELRSDDESSITAVITRHSRAIIR